MSAIFASSPNSLIQAMVAQNLTMLETYIERVNLKRGQVLSEANKVIEHIYFPESGVVSMTAASVGGRVTEVGLAGREGMTGITVLLGSDRAPHQASVQIEGYTALRIKADIFREIVGRDKALQDILLRYAQTYLVQLMHSVVSNARHRVEVRLARWLLMCHDRVDSDNVALTHVFLAMMVAAQRTGVTVSLHMLEGAGMIRSRRGLVTVLDRRMLEELAGTAYGAPEAEYRRLIGPLDNGP